MSFSSFMSCCCCCKPAAAEGQHDPPMIPVSEDADPAAAEGKHGQVVVDKVKPAAAEGQHDPPKIPVIKDMLIEQVDMDMLIEQVEYRLKIKSPNEGTVHMLVPADGLDRLKKREKKVEEWIQQIKSTFNAVRNADAVKEATNLAVDLLKNTKDIHWAFVGLSFIGWVLDRMDQADQNYKQCYKTVRILVDYWKDLNVLRESQNAPENIRRCIVEGTHEIVDGLVQCCRFVEKTGFGRFVTADIGKKILGDIQEKIKELQRQLGLKLGIDTYQASTNAPRAPAKVGSGIYKVGLDKRVEEVIQKRLRLEEKGKVVAVVLHGMGGIGKSTLADQVYNGDIPFPQKDRCYVVLGENLKTDDILSKQKQMIEQLTGEKHKGSCDATTLRGRLAQVLEDSRRRAGCFIYIDNVLKGDNLRDLLPEEMNLPKGSRLLITTRDKNVYTEVLTSKPFSIDHVETYPVELLSQEEAEELLCLHAFGEKKPLQWPSNVLDRVKDVVNASGKLPLALELVGRQLWWCNGIIDEDKWEAAITNLKSCRGAIDGMEEDRLYDALEYSYKVLSPELRHAFILVSTCFVGARWNRVSKYVETMWPALRLENLENLALVKKTVGWFTFRRNRIMVHDLLQALGRKHAKEEKLTVVPEEISKVNSQEANAFKWLRITEDFRQSGPDITLDKFKNLTMLVMDRGSYMEGECPESLQLLILEGNACPRNVDQLKLSGGLVYNRRSRDYWPTLDKFGLKEGLRWLDITDGFSEQLPQAFVPHLQGLRYMTLKMDRLVKLPSGFLQIKMPSLRKLVLRLPACKDELPANFDDHLKSLQKLEMEMSPRNLLISFKSVTQLRFIQLHRSYLKEIPKEIGLLSSLQTLRLHRWNQLEKLPHEIGQLSSLQEMSLLGCESLEELPQQIGQLSSLKDLALSECEKLKGIPENIGQLSSLEQIYLSGCKSLEGLPQQICQLSSLESLQLWGCEKLKGIPENIGQLSSLERIYLTGCKSLEGLPQQICQLSSLKIIYLWHCEKLKGIPENIGQLSSLEKIKLSGCKSLEGLPQQIGQLSSLKDLDLRDCEKLKGIPENIGQLSSLEVIDLSGCKSLEGLPQQICQLSSLIDLDLSDCENLKGIPENIGQLSSLQAIDLTGCEKLKAIPDLGPRVWVIGRPILL